MSSVYVTFDYVNQTTGAGQVCYNEIEALKEVSDVKQIVTKSEIGRRIDWCYPFNPFLYDYFAAQFITAKDVDMLHLSCSPANAILHKVRPKHYVVNCPAHDLEESIKEHQKITGTPYPFKHNTDLYLRGTLWLHLRGADAVITPSKRSADWIEDNIKPKRVVILPHGVTLPEKVDYPESFTNVGYIGAWGPDKGVKYLVDAWSKLNYSDSTLAFFGKGSKQMQPVLESWNAVGNYYLGGEFDSLDDIMHNFSVYIHPSVSEGYGMTVPEAMAYGKVVVVSEGTGSSMHIKHGVNGFTFKPRDVNALSSIIETLKTDFSLWKYVGIEARKTAETVTWEKIKKGYERLYLELLN